MYKYVLTAALIVGCTLPAFAEKGFYIVRGPDKKCVVVDVAPAATETTDRRESARTSMSRAKRPTLIWRWSASRCRSAPSDLLIIARA